MADVNRAHCGRNERPVLNALMKRDAAMWLGKKPSDLRDLADRLIYARARARMTQAGLGAAAGVHQSTVAGIEARHSDGAVSLAPIAKALGVHYEWLRDGREPMVAINLLCQFFACSRSRSRGEKEVAMKRLVLIWCVAPMVAHAVAAFFVREEPSDLPGKKVCVYNYMGREVGLLRPISSMCPMSVEMD